MGEIVDGEAVAFLDQTINSANLTIATKRFISVQSVVVDGANRLWILYAGAPKFGEPVAGGAKLVAMDLSSNEFVSTILLEPDIAVLSFADAIDTLAKIDRIDVMLLSRMAGTLELPVRPARSAQQAQMAELINARDGPVDDRTALKNREENLTVAFIKRHYRQLLEQVDRHIEALDTEIANPNDADAVLARRHQIRTSIAGAGTLTAIQFIATVPELGSLEKKQAASPIGLAPVARQSRQWKGRNFTRQLEAGALYACPRRCPI